MRNILIITPTPDESVSAYYTSSLVQSVKIAERNNINLAPVFLRDNSEHMVLNLGITLTNDENLDGVVFINREVSWDPENLMDLCSTDKDAAAIPVFDGNTFTLGLGEISRLEEDEKTGEIKVQSASTDFIYLSSQVVSKLCQTHPNINYGGRTVKAIMQGAECFNQYFSTADLLAYRLKEAGYEIWVNPLHNACKASRILQTPSFSEGLKKLRE
jgi:hypothetical protein